MTDVKRIWHFGKYGERDIRQSECPGTLIDWTMTKLDRAHGKVQEYMDAYVRLVPKMAHIVNPYTNQENEKILRDLNKKIRFWGDREDFYRKQIRESGSIPIYKYYDSHPKWTRFARENEGSQFFYDDLLRKKKTPWSDVTYQGPIQKPKEKKKK